MGTGSGSLKVIKNWKSHGAAWRSGHFYTFYYNAFRQDPNPVIILMYRLTGVHPRTGNTWNLLQAINLNYIPVNQRKIFVELWVENMRKTNGNVESDFAFPAS